MVIRIEIGTRTHESLQEIAAERGESLSAALDRVVEEARRTRILRAANEAYAAIAADPVEDALWRAEIAAWDCTLSDGLEPESWDEVLPDSEPANQSER